VGDGEGCEAWWAPCRAQCPTASLTDVHPRIQLCQEVEWQILTIVVVHGGFFCLLCCSSWAGRMQHHVEPKGHLDTMHAWIDRAMIARR
jgi:hypothetical protein